MGPKATATVSRVDRRNAARVNQKKKRSEVMALQRLIGGASGAPKIVAVIPLCPDIDPLHVASSILSHDDVETFDEIDGKRPGQRTVFLTRLKQRLTVLVPPPRDLFAVLDAAKVADFVLFLYSTTVEVDDFGELIQTALFAQGMPSTINVAVGLEDHPAKRQQEIRRSLQAYITSRFREEDTKLVSIDTPSDMSTLLRMLGTQQPRPIGWRETHPYMLVDGATVDASADGSSDTVTLRLSGYARGGGFSANRLVHIPNHGEFQLQSIIATPDPRFPSHRRGADAGDEDEGPLEVADPELRDSLLEENEPSPFAAEQTWPTDEEIAEATKANGGGFGSSKTPTRRVPKGTSSYQAAWIVDEDEEGDDGEENEEDADMDQQEGGEEEEEDDEAEGEEFEDVPVDDRALTADQLTEEEEERQLNAYRETRGAF